MPSEEPLMRAREVAALVERCRRASGSRRGDPILLRAAEMLEALAIESGQAPIADEGSGIGELREALRPYLQHRVNCRNRLRMGQRNCSCGLAEILAAPAPKQIAENANCSPETSLRKVQRTALARLLGASRLRAKTATDRQWSDLLAAALDVCIAFEHPDIDRSGLAQEVE